MTHKHERSLGQRDIFLFCISAVLLLDTLAAAASSGPELFFPELSLGMQIAIGLVLIWVVVAANIVTLEAGKWVPNIGAALKVLIFLALIIGAFNFAGEYGVANEFTLATLLPSSENGGFSLQYLPAVIYGMLGFELVSASSAEMKDPVRDIPRALFYSISIVVIAYVLATIAILVAVPSDKVDLVEGLVDTLRLLFGGSVAGDAFVIILGIGALYTFFSNGVTWGMGANRAAEALFEYQADTVKNKEIGMRPTICR